MLKIKTKHYYEKRNKFPWVVGDRGGKLKE